MTTVSNVRVKYRTATGWLDALTGVETVIQYPTATSVGVDAIPGWAPTTTITDDNLQIFETGAVIEDVRVINGSIIVRAPHVTVRRCETINGMFLNEYGGLVGNDCLYEDCTARCDPPGTFTPLGPTFAYCAYKCNRCAIVEANEGWRYGGSAASGANAILLDPDYPDRTVRLYNCYAQIQGPPLCDELGIDYHGDVIQAFDGGFGGIPLVVRNCAMYSIDDLPSCGASSIIGAGYNQTGRHNIDRLVLSGAATTYYNMAGGTVKNVYIEDDSWVFTPVSIPEDRWPLYDDWQAWTCTLVDGQPDTLVNSIPFGWDGFTPLPPP